MDAPRDGVTDENAPVLRRRNLFAWGLFGALSLPLLAGGVYTGIKATTGDRATATVHNCERSYRGAAIVVSCTGTWIRGDESLLAGGSVERGTVEGADFGDVGRTVDVRVSDGRAYTTSLATPIVLLAMGLAVLAFGVWLIRKTSATPALEPPEAMSRSSPGLDDRV